MRKLLKILFVIFFIILLISVGLLSIVAFQQMREINNLKSENESLKVSQQNQVPDSDIQEDEIVLTDYEIKDKKVKESGDDYTIDITYPEIVSDNLTESQDYFNNFLEQKVDQLADTVRDGFPSFEPSVTMSKFTLDGEYTITYKSERYISGILSYSLYLGGAHPDYGFTNLSYDLKENKYLKFPDLAKDFDSFDSFSDIIKAKLVAEFESNGDYDDSLAISVKAGTEPTIPNYSLFTFTDKNLTIQFVPYQVGPGALGAPKVSVSIEEIKDLLKSEFIEQL